MSEFKVLAHAMFNITVENETVTPIKLDEKEDFAAYSEQLLTELIDDKRRKSYKFRDMAELFPSSIQQVVTNLTVWDATTMTIACKLLEVEIKAQKRIAALDKYIQKGALLILLLSHEETNKIVVLKIEHGAFFDEIESKLKQGLPVSKQRLQKSCLICFNKENVVDEVLISDSGSSIREYWWDHFLATQELQSSELNTRNAFNAIDKFLRKEIKAESAADYWFLRNDVISYFRNNEQFAFDELLEKVKKHKPENKAIEVKFAQIIKKLETLPNNGKNGFDTQFQLEPKEINAKIKKTIILDDNFELRITGEIENLRSKISSSVDDKGKFIKIYSDKGYDEFGGA